MAGTPEGGRKAAEHTDPQVKSERGRQGAEALNADPEKKSAAAQKAAETRKKENPDAFKEMGHEGGIKGGKAGGQQSHGGKGSEET